MTTANKLEANTGEGFCWMKPFKLILAGFVAALGVIVVIFMAIPAPSFRRSVEISNGLPAAIEVKCSTLNGKSARAFHLKPTEHCNFIYFAGDHGGQTTIPILVETKILTNGFVFKRQFDLPTDNQPSEIVLTEKSFKPTN
jgi:hypothetical protein